MDMLPYLGISPPLMFAGFCGGVVNIFHFHRTKPREIVGAIVCGAFVANFCGLAVAHYTGTAESLFAAFLTGWFGLKWVAGLIMKRNPKLLFEIDDGEKENPNGT